MLPAAQFTLCRYVPQWNLNFYWNEKVGDICWCDIYKHLIFISTWRRCQYIFVTSHFITSRSLCHFGYTLDWLDCKDRYTTFFENFFFWKKRNWISNFVILSRHFPHLMHYIPSANAMKFNNRKHLWEQTFSAIFSRRKSQFDQVIFCVCAKTSTSNLFGGKKINRRQ